MKKWVGLAVLFLLISAAVLYFFVFNKKKDKKPADQENSSVISSVSKQNEAFNLSVENMLTAYYAMNEGFVNWDTAAVRKQAANFENTIDSFKVSELKTDSVNLESVERSVNAIKAESKAIAEDNNLADQRGSLNILSQALFGLLKQVKYDRSKIYFQECPMAFDDVNPGNWLSAQKEIRNPYMGTSHPKYKSGMIKCGSTKEVINYTGNVSVEKDSH